MTFPSVSQLYLSWCKSQGQTEKTLECKTSVFDSQLNTYFKDFEIKELTTEDIEVFKQKLWEQNYSYRYEVHIFSTLSSFLKWCDKQGYIDFNPFKSYITLKTKPEVCEFWSRKDYDLFISYFDKDLMWKSFFSLLFLTPIEHYQLRCVRLEDVDFRDNTITLTNTLVRRGNKKGKRERVKKVKFSQTFHLKEESVELLKNYIKTTDLVMDFPIYTMSYTSIYKRRRESCEFSHLKEIRFHTQKNLKKVYVLK